MTRGLVSTSVGTAAAVLPISLLLGCASVAPDAGVHEVQDQVNSRAGLRPDIVPFTPGAPPDDARLADLLRDGLTSDAAVEMALIQNAAAQAAFAELDIARADLAQAGLIRNPFLTFEIRGPGDPVRPLEVALTQSLFDLFQLRRRKGMARAAFESTKLRVAGQVVDLIMDVRSAFYAYQGRDLIVSRMRTIVDAARASAELAVRQRQAGNISALDLENEQAMLEQAKIDLARSELDRAIARERLNVLMGVSGEQAQWTARASLPPIPPEEPPAEDFERMAVTNRLDLAFARQEIEVAARRVPVARAEAIGDISVGIHHEREPEGLSTTGPEIALPLPLFDVGRPARSRAEALYKQAWQRYTGLAVQARSEARSAQVRLSYARQTAEYYRDVVLPRRRRILDLTQRRYNFMLADAFELLGAKREEIRAEREYAEALTEYWQGRTELARAVSGGLPAEARPPENPPGDAPSRPEDRHEPDRTGPPPAGANPEEEGGSIR